MSSTLRSSHKTNSSKTDNIELNTLPQPGKRSSRKSIVNMATATATTNDVSHKKHEKEKKGFKERLFGTKKPSVKGSSKYDVVRNVEVINYSRTDQDSIDSQKQLRKNSYIPLKTTYLRGHKFEAHGKPTWCDVCEDFIWGLYTQAMRCQYCRHTCHAKCVKYVMLNCPKAPNSEKSREDLTKETLEILSETDGVGIDEKQNNNLPSFVSSISQLRKIIAAYNDKSSLIMTLHDDCTFDGFIRVHMNLNRPVNISSDVSNLTLKRAVLRTKSGKAKRPLSNSRRPASEIFPPSNESSDIVNSSSDDSGVSSLSASSTLSSIESASLSSVPFSRKGQKSGRRLSFYMPKGTYKPLHVTSTTTAREVIEALLAKYNVTDNPKKFALYEKYNKIDDNGKEVVYKKIRDDEQPLVLCLSWGAKNSKSFALKEDEEGTVQWANFETPELNNFLKILQREEDELLAQIYQKYDNYRNALIRAIDNKVIEVSYTSEA